MKRVIRYGAAAVIAGLTATVSGQSETPDASSGSSYIQISKLVGRKVKSSKGEAIGIIKDVVIDWSNGCMAYTVVSTGGEGTNVSSGGGKIVAIPWSVYSSTSDPSVLRVNVDREKIYNAPVFEYTRIDEYARPDYKDNVYSYYGVNPGPRIPAAASSGPITGTDASGTAGATVSPGEVASPGEAGTASPRERASTRTHAASAANGDEDSSETPSPKRTRSARATDARPAKADEATSSPTSEESVSESTTSSSESKKRKASTHRPSATPELTEGED